GGLLLAVCGFFALPEELQNRFWTIYDPSVGPENAQESGQGRIEGFFAGIALWTQFPAIGCGPGAWKPATGRYLEAHNLYGQLLGELGSVGAAAFLFMIAAIFAGGRKLNRLIRENDPEPHREPLYHLTHAILISTTLLLFEGLFGHNLYRYN